MKGLEESLRLYSDVLNMYLPDQSDGRTTFSTMTKFNIRSFDTRLIIYTTYEDPRASLT